MTALKQTDAASLPGRADVLSAEQPLEIRVLNEGGSLRLNWADGTSSDFSAPFLRENSQSAGSKKLRLMGLATPAPENIAITNIKPIGSYAINIVFSDGYDRGIYPWIYLRELEDAAAPSSPTPRLSAADFLKSN